MIYERPDDFLAHYGVLNGKVPPASLVARATCNTGKKALAKQAARPIHVKSTIRKLA